MTRPITAGVDGSQESLAALDWAAREAVRRKLPLRVVHAWRYAEALATADRDTQHGWVSEGVREAVRTVSERHPELTVTTDLVEGGPVHALSAVAAEAEMLVLGSRGHGPVVGFLLGSVGQQVIAEATRPVVLVRAGTSPRRRRPAGTSWSVSTADRRTARRRCGSRSRRRRPGRGRSGGPGVDAAAGLRLQPGFAQAARRGGRSRTVREAGAGRGAPALAGAGSPRCPSPGTSRWAAPARCCCRWPAGPS